MSIHDVHIIDEYLTGRMKGTDLDSFEQELKSNAELQAAIKEREEMHAAIDALGDIEMKERVKRIHQQALATPTQVRRLSFWRYAAAAVIALALGLFLWFFIKPASPTDLYAQYYEPHALNFSSRDLNADQQLAEATKCFKNENYIKAIPILEDLLEKEIGNKDGIRLAAGISHLELGNDSDAMPYFKYLVDVPDSPYHEQGIWYAALLSLRKKDLPSAKNYLLQLSNDADSYYFKKATELLDKMD